MVVTDFNVVGIAVGEAKTDPPLVIDGNGVLPLPIALEGMEAVAGRHLEILKARRQIYVLQLPASASGDLGRKTLGRAREKEVAGAAIGERLDLA